MDLSTHLLQVNRTFQELALLKDIQEVWGLLGPQLFNFLNDSANVAMLQVRPGREWESSVGGGGVWQSGPLIPCELGEMCALRKGGGGVW